MSPTFSLVEVVNFIVELELEEAKSSTSMSNPFMPSASSISCVSVSPSSLWSLSQDQRVLSLKPSLKVM